MLTRSRQLHFVITTPAALSTNPQPASAHRLPSAKHPFWFSSILPPLRPSVSPKEERRRRRGSPRAARVSFFGILLFRVIQHPFARVKHQLLHSLYTHHSPLFSLHTLRQMRTVHRNHHGGCFKPWQNRAHSHASSTTTPFVLELELRGFVSVVSTKTTSSTTTTNATET